MARKTTTKQKIDTTGKPRRTKAGNVLAIDDNYSAPKRKLKTEKVVTLAEALAEAGQTIEELTDHSKPSDEESPTRPAGTSNLAKTIRNYRKGYHIMLHPNGKKTQNNGDLVAQALLTVTLAEMKTFSALAFGKSYDHLNPGQARMNIGNLIRGAVKKNNPAVVEWLEAQLKKIGATGDETAE